MVSTHVGFFCLEQVFHKTPTQKPEEMDDALLSFFWLKLKDVKDRKMKMVLFMKHEKELLCVGSILALKIFELYNSLSCEQVAPRLENNTKMVCCA